MLITRKETIQRIRNHRIWLESGGQGGIRIGTDSIATTFIGMDLDGVDLSLGFLYAAEFTDCSLRNAWLVQADLDGATFTRCDVTGTRFDGSGLVGAEFNDTDYSQASFPNVDLTAVLWSANEKLTCGNAVAAHKALAQGD